MPLSPDTRLSVAPGFALATTSEIFGVARRPAAQAPYALLRGNVADLTRAIDLVRQHGTVRDVVAALSGRMPAHFAEALLDQLLAAGFLRVEEPPAPAGRVAVTGEGVLARAIRERLAAAHLDVVLDEPRDAGAADFAVVALDGAPYGAIDEAGRRLVAGAKIPCLFVTIEGDAIWLGPIALPERGPGFVVARGALLALAGEAVTGEALDAMGRLHVDSPAPDVPATRAQADRAAAEVEAEVRAFLDPTLTPRCLDQVLALRDGATHAYPLGAGEGAAADAATPSGGRDLDVDRDVVLARAANLRERGERPESTRIRRVGIVGGGTAGYLTALALRAKLPELEVTVIESSKIPVIGVGEATTALLNHFLHAYLGLDIVDFYERVRPTWKLGIRFEWGLPGDYFFNSPFQFGKLLEAVVHDGDINTNCLGSRLMSLNTTPIVQARDGSHRCLLSEVPYAYHLDNRRFVRYLAEEAKRAGIRYLDAVIAEAVPTADRENIEHLRTDDGRELRFDLYVDCTGFRSLLLGKALGSEYTSYASSLFTDTAVVADVPNRGLVRPYTVAESMDHGWCWNIPMEDEDHRGYVFSSAFATVEEAAAEMRRKNPGMGDHWTVRFRSGRHAEFWRGNCVAIGNSFAFVEPLQSTAIHMIIVEIQKLVASFPREPGLTRFQPLVSREINEVWDTLRWFLSAHYKFNRKYDTPFWRECREKTDVTGIQEIIDLYRERAPIGATAHRFKELDLSTFGVYRYDLLFMGMGVETTLAQPDDDAETWRRASLACERLAARALPHLPALDVVRRNPALLRRHARELADI